MSIFQDTKVSKAFDALVNLAGSHGNNVIRGDLGDEGFEGARAQDTSEIGAAIAELKAAFRDVASVITPDDLLFAVRKVTDLVDFKGTQGGKTTQKNWDKWLTVVEAIAEARPDVYKWTNLRHSLAEVAGLERAKIRTESRVYVASGVETADPRPNAVRNVLARLDARADA